MKYILGLAVDFTLLAQQLAARDATLGKFEGKLTLDQLFQRYALAPERGGRIVGRPIVQSKDVTAEMVRIGAAWVYRTYSDDKALYDLERSAKAAKLGIWGLPEYERVPPWEWRRSGRSSSRSSSELEAFKCGEKSYCSEMVSCDEARFHLRSCGLSSIDGDGDGTPCETLCR